MKRSAPDPELIERADQTAFERLVAVRPAWTGIRRAAEALNLPERTLLHCGPPAHPSHSLVQPILNSAAVACVFEGWTETLDEGLELVSSGDVSFLPAQDLGVATPMAAVVSPSMKLIEMMDPARESVRAYAPINGGGTGGDPAPRYGRCDEQCVTFLHFLNDEVADMLTRACVSPLPWLPLIDAALLEGDDTHLRHNAAHGILMERLAARVGDGFSESTAGAFASKWPFFHLNFWMAGIRCVLSHAAGVPRSSLVTAMGGNGKTFGIQLSHSPGQWFCTPATPPLGHVRAPHTTESCVGALGDSALVEAFGLGALAHTFSPDMRTLHAEYYHQDQLRLPATLLHDVHPALPRSGARVGLCARRVVLSSATPVIELGLVERTGRDGGLGAGLYRPPLDVFQTAYHSLSS